MRIFVPTHVDDGYPPMSAEGLNARELGPGRAVITGIPAWVYGFARGDVVQLEVRRGAEDNPWDSTGPT